MRTILSGQKLISISSYEMKAKIFEIIENELLLEKSYSLNDYGNSIIQTNLVDEVLIIALEVTIIKINIYSFELTLVGKQSLGSVFGAVYVHNDLNDNIYIARNNGFLSIAQLSIKKSVKFESK